MAGRIIEMRKQLLQALKEVGVPGTWDHVVHQIGMFSFLGVSKVGTFSFCLASCWLCRGLHVLQWCRAWMAGWGITFFAVGVSS